MAPGAQLTEERHQAEPVKTERSPHPGHVVGRILVGEELGANDETAGVRGEGDGRVDRGAGGALGGVGAVGPGDWVRGGDDTGHEHEEEADAGSHEGRDCRGDGERERADQS